MRNTCAPMGIQVSMGPLVPPPVDAARRVVRLRRDNDRVVETLDGELICTAATPERALDIVETMNLHPALVEVAQYAEPALSYLAVTAKHSADRPEFAGRAAMASLAIAMARARR